MTSIQYNYENFHNSISFHNDEPAHYSKKIEYCTRPCVQIAKCWTKSWGDNLKRIPHYRFVARPIYKLLDGRLCPISSTLTSVFAMDYIFHQLIYKLPQSIYHKDPRYLLPIYALSITWTSIVGLPIMLNRLFCLRKEVSYLNIIHDQSIAETRRNEIRILIAIQRYLKTKDWNYRDLMASRRCLNYQLSQLIKALKEIAEKDDRLSALTEKLPNEHILEAIEDLSSEEIAVIFTFMEAYFNANENMDTEHYEALAVKAGEALALSEMDRLEVCPEQGADIEGAIITKQTCWKACQEQRKYNFRALILRDIIQLIFVASLLTGTFLMIQQHSNEGENQ